MRPAPQPGTTALESESPMSRVPESTCLSNRERVCPGGFWVLHRGGRNVTAFGLGGERSVVGNRGRCRHFPDFRCLSRAQSATCSRTGAAVACQSPIGAREVAVVVADVRGSYCAPAAIALPPDMAALASFIPVWMCASQSRWGMGEAAAA